MTSCASLWKLGDIQSLKPILGWGKFSQRPMAPSRASWVHGARGPTGGWWALRLGWLIVLMSNAAAAEAAPIDALLANLTLERRVGQMVHLSIKKVLKSFPDDPVVDKDRVRDWFTQVHIGTITNTPFDGMRAGNKTGWSVQEWRQAIRAIQEVAQEMGYPPVLYGVDHLHGANYVMGATLFPQQINLAASFDVDAARTMGRIMAKDTKAAGMQWVFGPVLDMLQQPLWSRSYETFGEDPYVIGEMAKAVIEGIQGDDERFPGLPKAAATMKHFIGYGNSRIGHDRAPVDVSDRTVRQMYAPPFQKAVDADVKACMECYIEIAGVPMVSNREYLINLLRKEMGFKGLLITDWKEMENLWTWHMAAANAEEAARIGLQDTSVDIFANPTIDTYNHILAQFGSGVMTASRLEESTRRMLELKEYLGLFDDPFALLRDDDPVTRTLVASVGSDEDKAEALSAARKSIVLAKNENSTLPLNLRADDTLLVVGTACNSLRHQSGGWTLHWQGAFFDGEFGYGTTVLEELKSLLSGKGVHVEYSEGPPTDVQVAAATAAVVCIGEGPYAEKPGDIDSPELSDDQLELVEAASASPTTPVTLIIFEGRPRLLRHTTDMSRAVVHAMLPGPAAGRAVAEILLGHVNPSARLPFTYPKAAGNMLHAYHGKPSERCVDPSNNMGTVPCPVEWPFGHGLSYTSFSYSLPRLSSTTVLEDQELEVEVQVTNTGSREGQDAVLLFITHFARRVTPEYKLLKRFNRTRTLAPGESTTVTFALTPREDLSFIGIEGRRVLESGLFYVAAGHEADCRVDPSGCSAFNLTLTDAYTPACESACRWLSEDAKQRGRTSEGDQLQACMTACRGDSDWDWEDTKCIERHVWAASCRVEQRCRLPGHLLSESTDSELDIAEEHTRRVTAASAAAADYGIATTKARAILPAPSLQQQQQQQQRQKQPPQPQQQHADPHAATTSSSSFLLVATTGPLLLGMALGALIAHGLRRMTRRRSSSPVRNSSLDVPLDIRQMHPHV